MQRIILHMDLDSFYASVEEKRKPETAGKPVVICAFSGRSADSGAVATANYRARELGIMAGISIKAARKLASAETAFLPNDIEHYRSVSERIMELLETECDALEQASVDEAYMDVTRKSGGSWENARAIAEKAKQKIMESEGLTCSIGIGPNKLVAKMASRAQKPDGLTLVRQEDVAQFMEPLDVRKIHGIGWKTAEILGSMGIKTAKQLAEFGAAELEKRFGKNKARALQQKAAGIDDSPVEQKEPQQVSRIGTLKDDTGDPEAVFSKLRELAESMERKIKSRDISFRTVSIIAVDTALETQTRSETIQQTEDMGAALRTARGLLETFLGENPGKRLRRVGIKVSNLARKKEQKSLGDFAERYFMR